MIRKALPMSPAARRPLRIGAVSYLNSKPLIEGLSELAPTADLVLDYPSRLADQLADGALDVALVPSFEFLREPGWRIVSDACVATRGPVLSVKLYSRVPAGEIRSLALDAGSRTSAALVQILLSERFGIRPQLESLPLGRSIEDATADAILLIGDRAMHPPGEEFAVTWDLGAEWTHWTGLPFVFALWAAPDHVDVSQIESAFCQARDRGVHRLPQIAAREAPLLGIDEQSARDYLEQNLHFRLSSAERSGLKLFRRLALSTGLITQGADLAIRDCASAR